jgi:amino acid transporter
VKQASRLNDILTFIKLLPLFLLVVAGLFSFVEKPYLLLNYSPFLPSSLSDFGTALVIIFWAYAGFELAPLPAAEVKDPSHTIPRGIATGIAIVTLFYLSTNFVIYGMVSSSELAKTMTPLLLVGTALFGSYGAVMMSAGALFSVSGSDESGVLGTSRLSYAMAIDGLFPKIFARIHPKYQTPYMALIIQGVLAFALSIFSGIAQLISFSVFNLAFSYLLTCMALPILKNESKKLPGGNSIPLAGILVCIYLLSSTTLLDKLVGSFFILLGIPVYVYFSPKTDIHHLKDLFTSEQAILLRAMENQNNFLAHAIKHVHQLLVKRL